MDKHLHIGLFGFGTVGRGLYEVLRRVKARNASIRRICVRDPGKRREGVDAALLCDDWEAIFSDPLINLVVELIDDAEASYRIVRRALESGIPAVTGNKKMLATRLEELVELQERTGTALLYDASACGSIPVIRNLEEYYDNDLLVSVKGILNGSSNFILSKIFNEGICYEQALRLAQQEGFAESDPASDVEGYDSLYKLVIITLHAFGVYVSPERVFNFGISTMSEGDIRFAEEKQRRIKLVGQVEKLDGTRFMMCVMPQLIARDKYIYSVEDEFNGVVIKGECYGKQFMFGRGAGGHPTGSAVLSDITARLHDYRYEYKKRHAPSVPRYTDEVNLRLYLRYASSDDLALFAFTSVSERYWSPDYKFVVGKISLSDLVAVREQLHGRDLFLAAYPEG